MPPWSLPVPPSVCLHGGTGHVVPHIFSTNSQASHRYTSAPQKSHSAYGAMSWPHRLSQNGHISP